MTRCFVPSLPMILCGWLLSLSILRAQEPGAVKRADETVKSEQRRAAEAEGRAATSCSVVDPIDQIKDEGLKRSQLMATLSYLTDVIGPRLSGSPNLKRANEWTCQTLTRWGLSGTHLEAWGPFGNGWSLYRFSAQVTEPQCIPLIAYPKAWSPSTQGTLTAQVIYFDAKTEADFANYKGKLKGAIVLTGPPHEVSSRFEPLAAQDRQRTTGPGRRRRADSVPCRQNGRHSGGSHCTRELSGRCQHLRGRAGRPCQGRQPRWPKGGGRWPRRSWWGTHLHWPGIRPAAVARPAAQSREACPDGARTEEAQITRGRGGGLAG